jgi:hypothetical protein
MTLHFCRLSSATPRVHGVRIEALAGAKAIVIRGGDIAKEMKERVGSAGLQSTSAFQSSYESLLGTAALETTFREELDHFRCLHHSRVAGALFVENFLARVLHNTSGQQVQQKRRDCIAESTVVARYFLRSGAFYCASMPYVEAHYRVSYSDKDASTPFLSKQADDCVRTLTSMGLCAPARPNNPSLGRLIDDTYFEHLYPDARGQLRERLYTLRTALAPARTSSVWPHLLVTAMREWRSVLPTLRARLRVTASPDNHPHPAVMSAGLTVDPAAFHSSKAYHNSLEPGFERPLDKVLNDFHWHILSRVCGVLTLRSAGVTEGAMRAYYAALRDFNQEWSPRAARADMELALIDNHVISIALNLAVCRLPQGSEAAAQAARAALSLYDELTPEYAIELRDTEGGLFSAVNCTHMQI